MDDTGAAGTLRADTDEVVGSDELDEREPAGNSDLHGEGGLPRAWEAVEKAGDEGSASACADLPDKAVDGTDDALKFLAVGNDAVAVEPRNVVFIDTIGRFNLNSLKKQINSKNHS